MKPRKTRIKAIKDVNGAITHIPQHRRWVKWYNFGDLDGISMFEHTNPYHVSITRTSNLVGSLRYAKEMIDTYIEKYNAEETRRRNIETASVTYIKYP